MLVIGGLCFTAAFMVGCWSDPERRCQRPDPQECWYLRALVWPVASPSTKDAGEGLGAAACGKSDGGSGDLGSKGSHPSWTKWRASMKKDCMSTLAACPRNHMHIVHRCLGVLPFLLQSQWLGHRQSVIPKASTTSEFHTL
eukprot:1140006-Pelagomonas_calceolata.AAC.9